MRRRFGRACALLCGALAFAAQAAAAPAIEGGWTLDETRSDDPEKALSGKLRKVAYPVPDPAAGNGEAKGAHEQTQESYWETVRAGKERRSVKDLRRLGSVYPRVKAARVDIAREDGEFTIVYDGELPRRIRPNPEGRVFSASGEELVVDTLGHTLSYWEKNVLVLESDPPEGGKVVERIRIEESPRRLLYSIRIEMRILKEAVEITRVFAPSGDARINDSVTAIQPARRESRDARFQ